ncbi:MAG: glycosyltransferase family 2 protein [Candidatus Hodarchaeales archaeon]
MIDIVLLTCNRLHFTKRSIEELYKRVKTPFRLIVVDNASRDGTLEYLEKLKREGKIYKLVSNKKEVTLCFAYDQGFEFVESEFFIMMQDDIIVPELEPDVIQQLIGLMKKYPNHGGIGCRIQRIPNMKWTKGDLSRARKALSAYFRIQRKSDYIAMGGLGNRYWDDAEFLKRMRNKLGKECSWANNLWLNHLGYCKNRGYPDWYNRQWSFPVRQKQDYLRKPYPKIDPKTNIPLKLLK